MVGPGCPCVSQSVRPLSGLSRFITLCSGLLSSCASCFFCFFVHQCLAIAPFRSVVKTLCPLFSLELPQVVVPVVCPPVPPWCSPHFVAVSPAATSRLTPLPPRPLRPFDVEALHAWATLPPLLPWPSGDPISRPPATILVPPALWPPLPPTG